MKKIVSLVLALCLCMCIAPCTFVSAATGDVLASYTFDVDRGGAYDSKVDYKNNPDGKDGFRLSDGKFVYDATGFTETTAREIVFNHTNLDYKAITVEMGVCFENDFPAQTTYWYGRFGGETPSNNQTLFSIYRSGTIAGTTTKLSVGETYNFSIVLIPKEAGTGYDKTLYVDGVLIKEETISTSGGLQMLVIDFDNHTVGSYASRSMKMSIDNIYILEGESIMTIAGADTLYKAPADVSVVYPFEAEYVNAGTTGSDGITWEITKNADKVKVDSNGNVTILDNSVTSFEIKASKTIGTRTISAVKTINLVSAVVHNFEDVAENTTKPSGWSAGTVKSEDGGNKYLEATANAELTLNFLSDDTSKTGSVIFECNLKVPAIPGSANQIITFKTDNSKWCGFTVTAGKQFPSGQTGLRNVKDNVWFNFKIENDLKTQTYNLYVDGIKVNTDAIAMSDTTDNHIFNNLVRVVGSNTTVHIDDIKLYSGKLEEKIESISAADKVLYAPVDASKSASTSFSATLKDNTFTPEWSLYGTYTGIEINKNTGKLTISEDAQAGDLDTSKLTVTAMATAGGLSKETSIDLYKYSFDFNTQPVGEKPTGNWMDRCGLVAQDGSDNNYYVAPELQNDGYQDARYKVNSAIGNFVIEAKVRLNSNVTSGSLFTYNQAAAGGINSLFSINSSGVSNYNNKYHYPSMSVDATDWINIKAVMNVDANTTTVFVDGKLLGASNIPMTANTGTTSVNQLIFRGLDVDDLKVYNINDTAPGAYNAHLENLAIGKESAPIYDYFDEGGQAEECSSYQWYIGETAGGSFTAISGKTEKTYTPDAADLGKYIYVEITPASDESHTGVAVKTAPEKVGDIAIGDITYKVNNVAKAINEVAIAKDGTEQTISLTMPARYTGSEPKNVFIIIGKYVDGQFSVVDYEKVTLTNADTNITVEGTVAIPAADAGKTTLKAFIWDGTLSPLFEVKNLK